MASSLSPVPLPVMGPGVLPSDPQSRMASWLTLYNGGGVKPEVAPEPEPGLGAEQQQAQQLPPQEWQQDEGDGEGGFAGLLNGLFGRTPMEAGGAGAVEADASGGFGGVLSAVAGSGFAGLGGVMGALRGMRELSVLGEEGEESEDEEGEFGAGKGEEGDRDLSPAALACLEYCELVVGCMCVAE